MLRTIAILLNLIVIGLVMFFIITEGFPPADQAGFWYAIIITITPCISAFCLFRDAADQSRLTFRIKTLEETIKVEETENKESKV